MAFLRGAGKRGAGSSFMGLRIGGRGKSAFNRVKANIVDKRNKKYTEQTGRTPYLGAKGTALGPSGES